MSLINSLKSRARPNLGFGNKSGSGTLYSDARFGQILYKPFNQDWRNIDTGTLNNFNSIYVTSDSSIIAGGELNQLVMIKPDKTIFQIDTSNIELGSIIFVYFTTNEEILIGHQSEVTKIYYSKNVIVPEWSLIGSVTGRGKWSSNPHFGNVEFQLLNHNLVVKSKDNSIYVVDLEKRKLKLLKSDYHRLSNKSLNEEITITGERHYKLSYLIDYKDESHIKFRKEVCGDALFKPDWLYCLKEKK